MLDIEKENDYPKGRIALSIIGGIGWLIFILLFTAFWSTEYTTFQSLVISVVSFLVVGALIGLMWVLSGYKGKK